jgi:hypothetical protein
MAKNIRQTMQGQVINVDLLRNANQGVIAVGNMSVNARGDQVSPDGSIIKTRNEIMRQKFTKPSVSGKGVPRRSADSVIEEVQETPAAMSLAQQVFQEQVQTPEPVQESSPTVELASPTRTAEAGTPFGPRSSDLRGSLASDVNIDLSDVTKPVVRTIRRI